MAEQRTAKDRERHLYLVFDDWRSGYSIRKVSLSRRSGKHVESSGSGQGAEPLPGVFMRIQADRGYPEYFASAFGTKILAMHPGIADGFPGIPMINVEEQCLVYGPEPNYNAFPIYFPVGDNKIFVLDIGTFHCYLWRPGQSEPWWREDLPFPPFKRAGVCSYAVQPDGCILVSTKSETATTFILDTTEERSVWKPYGNWVLPFTGRGHYDSSLEGFVGLSKDPETLGHLYCSTKTSIGDPSIDFKCSKSKVFNMNSAERHINATLLHMRPGTFCVVECVSIDNARADQVLREPGSQCGSCFMYRVKTFSLGYDAKGDLKLNISRVRCYNLPQEVTSHFINGDIAAFWL